MDTNKPRELKIDLNETIHVRDSFFLESWIKGTKRALAEVIGGWFPSKRVDLSPDGVTKERVIDRRGDRYKEKVVDERTGRVIRDVDEELTEHRK